MICSARQRIISQSTECSPLVGCAHDCGMYVFFEMLSRHRQIAIRICETAPYFSLVLRGGGDKSEYQLCGAALHRIDKVETFA